MFFLGVPLLAYSQVTVDQFMGVNTRGQDPIARMKAVGTVREFHPWVFNEGFPNSGNASPNYPDNQYRWNPNYIDYIRYDDFYQSIQANGLTISPVTLRSIPQIVSPFLSQGDPNATAVLAQKPIIMSVKKLCFFFLQVAVDRLAQVLQISLSTGAFRCSLADLRKILRSMPPSP